MIVIALVFCLLALYGILLERVNRIPYKVNDRKKNKQVMEAIGMCLVSKQSVWYWLITKQTLSIFGVVCVYYCILGFKRKIYLEEYPILYTDLPYVVRKIIYKLYLSCRYTKLQKFIHINKEEFVMQMDELMIACDEKYKELLMHIKEQITDLIEKKINFEEEE